MNSENRTSPSRARGSGRAGLLRRSRFGARIALCLVVAGAAVACARSDRPPPAAVQHHLYVHSPYQTHECEPCHEGEDGTILKTPEFGLCLTACHTDFLGEDQYLHGPVNLNACLPCHHYHESKYAKILVAGPTDICFQCHERADVSKREEHNEPAERGCIDCHNPHKGSDPFFLRTQPPME